ncbi:MAG: superoxide dismutase [Caulobacteraceae bacterium]
MFKLPDLPYGYDALQPTISAETMHLHHDKHHAKYVQTANDLCAKEGLDPASLEDLIVQARDGKKTKLFNNAAQIWNHTFFWTCMSPETSSPTSALAAAIDQAFGGMDGLKAKFTEEGGAHFGSGWVWLAAGPQGLQVLSTHDGEDLVGHQGLTPLLVCDLWEHAYYVDYKNDRAAFLNAWFDALPDWGFAGHQFAAAQGQGDAWRHPLPESEGVRRQA